MSVLLARVPEARVTGGCLRLVIRRAAGPTNINLSSRRHPAKLHAPAATLKEGSAVQIRGAFGMDGNEYINEIEWNIIKVKLRCLIPRYSSNSGLSWPPLGFLASPAEVHVQTGSGGPRGSLFDVHFSMSKTNLSGILGFQDHSKCSGYISITTINPIVGLCSMFALAFGLRLQPSRKRFAYCRPQQRRDRKSVV